MALSDKRLVQRACDGDQGAFATIFRRYHQALYRYCLAIVGNEPDAQDALQSTMVNALRSLPGETRQIQLKPWLYRIAHNESVELLRRRRRTDPLDPELAGPTAAPEATVEVRDRLRRLVADLGDLPERQRSALVMRELADLDFDQIAEALDTSAAAARQGVYEARLGLRQIEMGREMSCTTVTKALSDADGRTLRRRDIRAHLRSCAECRAFRDAIADRRTDLAALAPLPAVAAGGLLQGLLGAQAASTGGGLAGAIGGGAGKVIGASALTKTAATAVVVVAVGAAAGDRAGVFHRDGSSPAPHNRQAELGSPPPARGTVAPLSDQGGEGPATSGQVSRQQEAVERLDRATSRTRPTDGGEAPPGQAPGQAGRAKGHGGSSSGKAHGRGHAKQLPAASAHGQETAASKRGHGKGASGVAHGQGKGGGPNPKPASHEQAGKGPQHAVGSPPPKTTEPEPTPAADEQAQTHGQTAPPGKSSP